MAAVKIAVLALMCLVGLAAAQGGRGRGSQGRGQGPPEGAGQGADNRRFEGPIPDALLQRAFPDGVPAEITAALALGTPEGNRQAWELLRQARREQRGPGGQGPPEGAGPGADNRRFEDPIPDALLQRTFPDGVPAEITAQLALGTPEGNRQAWELLRQARREQRAQGAQGRGPQRGQGQGRGGRGRRTTTPAPPAS